jgi:hypothetical protein
VYCLHTNQAQWDEATLRHTSTMLTDLEKPQLIENTPQLGPW